MFREGHQANTRVHFALTIALILSGCEATVDDQAAIDGAFDHSNIPTAPSAPAIPITEITGCRVERFTQPEATIAEKLDLLFVFDTSASLNAERGRVADGIDAFIAELPPSIDLRIAVMPAHGPKSSWAGKLFRRNSSEPWVLDSKVHTLTQIRAILKDKLTKNQPQDNESDGGEMGLYSLTRGMDADRVVLAQSQGFFRSDAALALAFLADENDICAIYPAGVTPLVDPQGVENKAIRRGDCAGITQNNLLAKLKTLKGSYPLTVGGVIYNNVATVPHEDENEFGYGYFDFIQYSNGITIDMADANYRTGLSNFGNRASVALNLKTEFEVASAAVSSASVYVLIDGLEAPAQRSENDVNKIVLIGSPGISKSTIDITYCDLGEDSAGPTLTLSQPGLNPKLGENDVSGSSNEALSQITLNGQALTITQDRKSFSGKIQLSQVGSKTLTWLAVDLHGNRTQIKQSVQVQFWEQNAPIITSNLPTTPSLTSDRNFNFTVQVVDESATETVVKLNGREIERFSIPSSEIFTQLDEGVNFIELKSTDIFGNTATVVNSSISIDTTPPTISVTTPIESQIILGNSVSFSGTANEPLSMAKIDGESATLSADKKAFTLTKQFAADGAYSIVVTATDLVGNQRSLSRSIVISSRVLNVGLVSVLPQQNSNLLIINGAPGAAQPGASLSAQAGVFNRGSATAKQDGSFQIALSPFSQGVLTATFQGRTETTNLTYGSPAGIHLSGRVYDTTGHPLPGVTVSIQGTQPTLQATTNSAGVFEISEPISGIQKLEINGASVPTSITGTTLKYGKTLITVRIGAVTSSVLQRPIYLAPLRLDTGYDLPANAATTVTSPEAPGVELKVAAGSATFPDGTHAGKISIQTLAADFATVPAPKEAEPTYVYSFEPSGLTFSEPAEVRLPNVYELPRGTELHLLSMNSKRGVWEVGGAAKVDENGEFIVSKPNSGLLHFSTVYAVPTFPEISEIAGAALNGPDTFSGSVSTNISLPVTKILQQDIAPTLDYKSTWAYPNLVVRNSFSVPRKEITVEKIDTASESYYDVKPVKSCFLFFCSTDYKRVKRYVDYEAKTVETNQYFPDQVTAQFYSRYINSEPLTFSPTDEHPIPARAQIAYAFEAKNVENGEFLETGTYSYGARYEVRMKNLVIRTRNVVGRIRGNTGEPIYVNDEREELGRHGPVFGQDVTGTFTVQNHVNSAVGRGWRLGGIQRILDPNSGTIKIEEDSGEVSTFVVKSKIETIADWSTRTDLKLYGLPELSQWPNAYFLEENGIYQANLLSGSNSIQKISSLPNESLNVSWVADGNQICRFVAGQGNVCEYNPVGSCWKAEYRPRHHFYQLVRMMDGSLLASEQTNSLYQLSPAGFENILYPIKPISFSYVLPRSALIPAGDSASSYLIGGNPYGSSDLPLELVSIQTSSCQLANFKSLLPPSSGLVSGEPSPYLFPPIPEDPQYPGTRIMSRSQYNAGLSVTPDGKVTYVNSSYQVVLKLDPVTKEIKRIAGNFIFYNADGIPLDPRPFQGKLATEVQLSDPKGIIQDSIGNTYLSTREGFIHKVDSAGRFSTLVGLNVNLRDVTDGLDPSFTALSEPQGMLLDEEKGYLYIADSGRGRVFRLDLENSEITTIAGGAVQTSSSDLGDGKNALQAILIRPTQLGFDDQKNLLIFDEGNKTVRRVVFEGSTSGQLAYVGLNQYKSELTRNSDGTWKRTYRNGRQDTFNQLGQITNSTERSGKVQTYYYDGSGRLQQTVIGAPSPQIFTYSYAGGFLYSISDPAGRVTRFTHTGSNLTSVEFPDGSTRRFDYDGNGLLIKEINSRNLALVYRYNNFRRLTQIVRPDGKAISINDSVSQSAVSSSQDAIASELKSIGLGDGQIVDSIKDARDVEIKVAKDSEGFFQKLVDESGNVTDIERDLDGRIERISRPDETIIEMTYDSVTGDQIAQRDSKTGRSTSQTFDAYGQILSQTNARGFTSIHTYDPVTGALISSRNALGQEHKYTYGNFGLVKTSQDPLGKISKLEYDEKGNLKSTTNPLNEKVTLTRNSAGRVEVTTDPSLKTARRLYDSMNRLIEVTTPKGEKTRYEYLPTGEISLVVDPKENETSYEYNDYGQMVRKIDPLGKTLVRTYDENGNVLTETDPNGNHKRFVYDEKNRLIEEVLPDDHVTYIYNSRGDILSATNNNAAVKFKYNLAGELIETTSSSIGVDSGESFSTTLNFGRDSNGNRSSVSTTGISLSYEYDALDRIEKIHDSENNLYEFAYDSAGRLRSLSRQGGKSEFEFDDADRILGVMHKNSSGVVLSSYGLTRDLAGRIDLIQMLSGTKNIDYDDNAQVTNASNPDAAKTTRPDLTNESFQYSSVLNRTEDQGGSYQYDSSDQRLISDHRNFYFHDENGNLVSRQAKGLSGEVTQYRYSSKNQLIAIRFFKPALSDPSQIYVAGSSTPTREVLYRYDPFGRRIWKKVVNLETPAKSFSRGYLYDGPDILLETDGNYQTLARYTNSTLFPDDVLKAHITVDGQHAGLAQAQGDYYYLKDHVGSISEIVDASGSKIQRYVYSVYGQRIGILSATDTDITTNPILNTSFGFTGREHDEESGLTYYRARYYMPELGRFMQKDPEPGRLDLASSVINAYIYGGNNPVSNVDPSGRSFWSWLGGLFAFIAAAFVVVATAGAAAFVGAWLGGLAGGAVGGGLLGGLAGAAAGAIGGAIVGAAGGYIAGGLAGGGIALVSGESFADGWKQGSAIGAAIGAAVGASIGGAAGFKAGFGGVDSLVASSRPWSTPWKGWCRDLLVYDTNAPKFYDTLNGKPVWYQPFKVFSGCLDYDPTTLALRRMGSLKRFARVSATTQGVGG